MSSPAKVVDARHPIEEFLQINIHHHLPAFLHMALCLPHRVVGLVGPVGSRSCVRRRSDLISGCRTCSRGLLNQPVRSRSVSPAPRRPATRLGYLHSAHRLWPVPSPLAGSSLIRGHYGLEILSR